jgi:hypothetical protein
MATSSRPKQSQTRSGSRIAGHVEGGYAQTRDFIIVNVTTTKGRNVENKTTTVEETCECGFTFQNWMDFDVECSEGLHLWERES